MLRNTSYVKYIIKIKKKKKENIVNVSNKVKVQLKYVSRLYRKHLHDPHSLL